VIFPGETGILIPPGDPEAIARATIQLLNDRAFARHLGENGRILIEKRFLIKHMMDNTANLYQNLLKKKRIIL
jgi:glycosyltransferase involved in cell wall biosynthesis